MIRKAKAVWRGTGRDGDGDLTTDSGVLHETPYSFKTRFENEKGTNPEELIAAAHAGCFTMALAFQLQTAGYTPSELIAGLGDHARAGRRWLSHQPLGADPVGRGSRPRSGDVRRAGERGGEDLSGLPRAQCREITLAAPL